jgi:sterol desaturase/sphingolipid hydroxylase (fatty acid hydroxylase superfamily)
VSWRILSPIIIVAGALVLIALERRFPYRPGQRLLRAGLWTDLLLYAFAQSYVLGLLIDHGARALPRLGWVTAWPPALQLAFFIVLHDLYIYGFHRLQHRVPLLWRIHEAHHSGRDVDWLSGARSHPLEILINQTIEFVPMSVLGAAPGVIAAKLALDVVWGMYIHSNVDARRTILSYVLNGPELHRWHHATDVIDVNFATKLALWDWLLGTSYHPAGRKPEGYGLVGAEMFPAGYLGQLTFAFRRRARL